MDAEEVKDRSCAAGWLHVMMDCHDEVRIESLTALIKARRMQDRLSQQTQEGQGGEVDERT